jgi:hypothetical protein
MLRGEKHWPAWNIDDRLCAELLRIEGAKQPFSGDCSGCMQRCYEFSGRAVKKDISIKVAASHRAITGAAAYLALHLLRMRVEKQLERLLGLTN